MDKIEEFLTRYCAFSLEMHGEYSPHSHNKDEYELRLPAEGLRKLVADTEFATVADSFKLVDAPTSEKVAVVIVDLTSIDTKSVVDCEGSKRYTKEKRSSEVRTQRQTMCLLGTMAGCYDRIISQKRFKRCWNSTGFHICGFTI